MRAGEARRRLRTIGWRPVRTTSNGHDIWLAPNGEQRMFSLGHSSCDIHRNAAAAIIRAERVAQYTADPETVTREELMSTTAVTEPIVQPRNGVHPEPAPIAEPKADPKIIIYRPRNLASPTVLYFGKAEADELGGVGARVSILHEKAGWVLRANPGGMSTLRPVPYGDDSFQVTSSAIGKVLQPTARTEIPAERANGGYLLFPDLITPVPFASDESIPEIPVTPVAPTKTAGSLWATARQQHAERMAQVETAAAARQDLVPITRQAPVEELRLALNRVRQLAGEAGAELYVDSGGMLRAKVTVEI